MPPEIMMLLSLFLVPVSVFIVALLCYRRLLFGLTGLTLGLVIAPASLGLYGLFFVSPVGFVPGMVGLVLTLIHVDPGYRIAMFIGVVDPHSLMEGNGRLIVDAFNGLVWGGLYGALGYAIDVVVERRGRGRQGSGPSQSATKVV